ncbi:MAG: hypothetical protein J0H14_27555, partial [Alphaproteobacteria bacterium]|nr:hypothetical protein [Alphaproteobacteria bacterium]
MARFAGFIGAVKRAMGEGFSLRQLRVDGDSPAVTPLFFLLERYLTATLRRFTALHARFLAGTLAAAPCKRSAVAASDEGATAEQPKTVRRASAIPPGPVLLTEFGVRMFSHLQALLEDPEMRAFLAAAPQAGRILRPLWRKLSPDPALPEILRLPPRPPRPRKPRAPRPPRPAKPAPGSGPPRMRRVTLPDGTRSWEPTPCYPFGEKPPRARRPTIDPWMLEPDPPPAPPRRPPVRPA